MGGLDAHLIHGSPGPPESSTETASYRCSLFAGLTSVTDRQTDRQTTDRPTDHATQSATIGRIYVRNTAMQPNKLKDTSLQLYFTQFDQRCRVPTAMQLVEYVH